MNGQTIGSGDGTSLFIGILLGNLEGGSFTIEFEEWMKGALEVEDLSLRELCEGNLEGAGAPLQGTLENV